MLRWTLRHPRLRLLQSCAGNGVSGVRFARTRHPSGRPRLPNTESIVSADSEQSTSKPFALTTYDVDGRALSEESAYRFPAPPSQSSEDCPPGPVHKAGDFPQDVRGARSWVRSLLRPTDGGPKSAVNTAPALSAAHRFLNEMPMDSSERGYAYYTFYRAFLRHPYGAVPARSLLDRQIAEGIPLSPHRALTALKAVRECMPPIRDLMPVLSAEMTPKFLAAIAHSIVLQTQAEPAAVEAMIGSALAAMEKSSAKEKRRTSVPRAEWPLELFFPLLLAYFPRADFRGAIRVLGDLRAAAHLQRELAHEANRGWPGTASRPIVACYTAAMSLWVRSHLEPRSQQRARAGVRVGSSAPSQLAADLAAILEPLPDYKPDVLRDWGVDSDASTSARRSHVIMDPQPHKDASPEAAPEESLPSSEAPMRKFRHRRPFLTTWLNAERIAHNLHNAARVWEQIAGQSVAATIAGNPPSQTPWLEAYVVLLKLLKISSPPSYRPLASLMVREGVPIELLNGLLACIAVANPRGGDTWTSAAGDVSPPVHELKPAPSPDLVLMHALLERGENAVDMRTVDIVGAAIIRAARQGINTSRFRFVPAGTHAHIGRSEWDWLNDAVWSCAQAEAARQGGTADVLPHLPLSQPEAELEVLPPSSHSDEQLADVTTTVSFPGQQISVRQVLPALKRLLRDALVENARQRRVDGSADQVLAAEMAALPSGIVLEPHATHL